MKPSKVPTNRKVEIDADLASRTCLALISCVDELQAIHTIKYGHICEATAPRIQERMDFDDAVKNDALGVLLELHDFLKQEGLDPITASATQDRVNRD